MLGVRRLFAATAGSTPPPAEHDSQPTSPESPLSPTPVALTNPLTIPTAKPSWPPSPLQSPIAESPHGSPKMTTAALFLRKDRQRPANGADELDTSLESSGSSRYSHGLASPTRSQGSSPVAGPSSPRLVTRPLGVSALSRSPAVLDTKRSSEQFGANREDLLMSLLASEAIVDSRDSQILSAEEVEELKKEHRVFSSRLEAMRKKLTLETKIRDAALSLARANASYKNVSKQTSEQLDAANRKVDLAQKEFWRLSERAGDVHRRLLEHRAGVLSNSVRSLERKANRDTANGLAGVGSGSTSGYSTPARSSLMSPPASSVTSMQTSSSKGRFEGAHFFAGHADTVIPRSPRAPLSNTEVAALEEKLKAATAALEQARAKQAEAARELSMLRLEKDQVETMLGMELQNVQDNFEDEAAKAQALEAQLRELDADRENWAQDRAELEERRRQVEDKQAELDALVHRIADLEQQSGDASDAAALLAREREVHRAALDAHAKEREEAQLIWDADRAAWGMERAALQEDAAARDELEAAAEALQQLMAAHEIRRASRDGSVKALLGSVQRHLEGLRDRVGEEGLVREEFSREREEWAREREEWTREREELARARDAFEDEMRVAVGETQTLAAEADAAKRERDDARAQVLDLESQLKEQAVAHAVALAAAEASSAPQLPPVQYTGDVAKIVEVLQPAWAVLPSAEARASRLGARISRGVTGSPGSPIASGRSQPSLSEMDVRSLKTLYDPRAMPPGTVGGAFSVEAFAARVQALVVDDRALIERLLRFAQAHDLLKKNAERAQKLAQDSNAALETYQRQVTMLEDRNIELVSKNTALQEEVERLEVALDRITNDKIELEMQAAEQAETCRQLTEANNTLSARALNLASEAASASDSVRKNMESQLAECNAALAKANEELETVRGSQQMQQMALLEELNSVQTENSNLRAQLRKK